MYKPLAEIGLAALLLTLAPQAAKADSFSFGYSSGPWHSRSWYEKNYRHRGSGHGPGSHSQLGNDVGKFPDRREDNG